MILSAILHTIASWLFPSTPVSKNAPTMTPTLISFDRPSYLPTPDTKHPLGLLCGTGHLPVRVAQHAKAMGYEVVAFTLFSDNKHALKPFCKAVVPIAMGQVEANLALSRMHNIKHVVFAGKVNKWLLFKNPKLDTRALHALNQLRQRNDDQLMLGIIDLLAEEGLSVLNQSDFLHDHFIGPGLLTHAQPTEQQWHDCCYGYTLAKQMGRADVGQTVVVHDGMALAIEAIEGTDECLKRAGKWSRKRGGTVVKVAKPNQDQRFDIPTVGLGTLKRMRKEGLTVLATEANRTFFIDPDAMASYANSHGLLIVSTELHEQTGVTLHQPTHPVQHQDIVS